MKMIRLIVAIIFLCSSYLCHSQRLAEISLDFGAMGGINPNTWITHPNNKVRVKLTDFSGNRFPHRLAVINFMEKNGFKLDKIYGVSNVYHLLFRREDNKKWRVEKGKLIIEGNL